MLLTFWMIRYGVYVSLMAFLALRCYYIFFFCASLYSILFVLLFSLLLLPYYLFPRILCFLVYVRRARVKGPSLFTKRTAKDKFTTFQTSVK